MMVSPMALVVSVEDVSRRLKSLVWSEIEMCFDLQSTANTFFRGIN